MTKQEKDKTRDPAYMSVEYDFRKNKVPNFMNAEIQKIRDWLNEHNLEEEKVEKFIERISQVREEYNNAVKKDQS